MIARYLQLVLLLATLTGASAAGDESWPTYRHDTRRSGATPSTLTLPLAPAWTHTAGKPSQAWSGPAKWDAYSGNSGLQSMRNFDPCHYTTAADGHVYFGSSADDAAHCLDAATGKQVWTHFTNAPVRLPPSLADGLAWFGSDDGHAYCVDAKSGDLLWTKRAAPSDRLIASNGKLISPWPVRTGVLIDRGKAWFTASLVPWERSYLYCVDARTGSEKADGCFVTRHHEVTLQGAMLAGSDSVYIPQGRAAPLAFSRTDGKHTGTIGNAGGVTCVLLDNDRLLAGPENQKSGDSQIRLTAPGEKKPVATFNHTSRATVDGNIAYLHSGQKLRSLDIAESDGKDERWSVTRPAPVELIVAGPHLILGYSGHVDILDTTDGKQLATLEVEGTAHGLTVAAGRLFVSTDRGLIHAFAQP